MGSMSLSDSPVQKPRRVIISEMPTSISNRIDSKSHHNDESRNHVGDLYRALVRPVSVQGPLLVDHNSRRFSGPNDNPRTALVKSSDISCIRSNVAEAGDAPIVIISYENGTVDFCILTSTNEVSSMLIVRTECRCLIT